MLLHHDPIAFAKTQDLPSISSADILGSNDLCVW